MNLFGLFRRKKKEPPKPGELGDGESWGPWVMLRLCTECKRVIKTSKIETNEGVCPACGHWSGSEVIKHYLEIGRQRWWFHPLVGTRINMGFELKKEKSDG